MHSRVQHDMEIFGEADPRMMPGHFFLNALEIDYSSAIRADTSKQSHGVAPRFWYIDARFRCDGCGSDFIWSALEQRTWFETLGFHVEARPKHCQACSRARRDALQLRREYDALVGAAKSAGTREQMSQIVRIVDELEASMGTLPDRMRETRARFRRALAREDP